MGMREGGVLLGPGEVREDSAEKAMFMDFITNVSYREQPSRLGMHTEVLQR